MTIENKVLERVKKMIALVLIEVATSRIEAARTELAETEASE